ncbi:MAG: serine/threonine-protein kinase [Archangium sp.]|nr:serine/threonine-protein kinase [Archangium sp.]
MSTPTTKWFPGGRIGRYVLISPLASGGMAEIWLARQSGLHGFEKIVVIKRMIGALQDDPDHVAMFLSEARLAAGLSHRHVVQIYELGEDKGSFYIVMEFVEGESLARVYKANRAAKTAMPVPIAVQLIAWAAEGLHYAHTLTDSEGKTRGIIHRDVSPQNLLLTADGSIKLVDFGIAKVASEETSSGKLKGKIAYMPPEQARAEQLDPRADVFALGVVLFELVSNTRLFGKMDDLEILNHLISNQPLPHCSERNAAAPKELDALIARAMAPQRDERFASAREFQTALENWLSATGQRASTAEIADYLNRLFPERAAERRTMLDAARKGEALSPELASNLFTSSGSGSVSEPSHVGRRANAMTDQDLVPTHDVSMSFEPPRRPPSKTPLFVALALGFLVLAGGGYAVIRPSPAVEVPDAGPPRVAPASLAIECTPIATVVLDGKPAGPTPLTLNELALGEHTVVLRAPGHHEQRRTVTLSAGEKLQLVFALEKDAPVPVVVDAGVAVKATPVVARANGKLNLRTTPWTSVYLGKRKLGDTPLVGVSLPAGSHVLKVVNAEAGVQSSIEVTIQANKTTSENLVLK